MEKVFISGPISGLPYVDVKTTFDVAEDVWRNRMRQKYRVVNPTTLCSVNWSWWRCMAVCLWHLIWCSHIYMLLGWHNSRGARIEHRVARALRKRIIYQKNPLWKGQPIPK